jgi:hypothetical protein
VRAETLSVYTKELIKKTLDGMVVDRCIEAKKVEIYIDERRSLLRTGHYRLSQTKNLMESYVFRVTVGIFLVGLIFAF